MALAVHRHGSAMGAYVSPHPRLPSRFPLPTPSLWVVPEHHLQVPWQAIFWHTAAAKSLQSCPILCDPIDGSPPGSPIPGILQARTLEWVAISFSNAWEWKVKVKLVSCVRLFTTPWTAGYQAPSSMGFSRQENWSGVPLPSPFWHTFLSKSQNMLCLYEFYKEKKLWNIFLHV